MDIVLNNITKSYNNNLILDSVSLTIESHDFMIIFGESGCGKTTLLQIIAGLNHMDFGEILYNDSLLNHKTYANEISYLFQDHKLLEELNVRDNIVSGIQFTDKKFDEDWLYQVCKELNIHSILDKKISTLSTGQKQRVAIARALIKKPSLLLLDEPTGNLDENNTQFLLDFLEKIHQETNITIVLVTHEQRLMNYGNKIVKISDRKLHLNIIDNIKNSRKQYTIYDKKHTFLNMLHFVDAYTKKHSLYYLFMSFCISIVCLSFFLSVNVGSNFRDYIYNSAYSQENSCEIALSSINPSGKITIDDIREIEALDHVTNVNYNLHHSYAFERDKNNHIVLSYGRQTISDSDRIVDFFGSSHLSSLVMGTNNISGNEIIVDENIINDLGMSHPLDKEIKISLPVCLYFEKRNMSDTTNNSVDSFEYYVPINKQYTFTFKIKGVIRSDYEDNYVIIHDKTFMESQLEELSKSNLNDNQFTSFSTTSAIVEVDHIDNLFNVIDNIESHYEIKCNSTTVSLLEDVENIDKIQSIYSLNNIIIIISVVCIVYSLVVLNYSRRQKYVASLQYLGADKKDIIIFHLIELMYIICCMIVFLGIILLLFIPYINNILSTNNPFINTTQVIVLEKLELFTLNMSQIVISIVIGTFFMIIIQFLCYMRHKQKALIEIIKWEVR